MRDIFRRTVKVGSFFRRWVFLPVVCILTAGAGTYMLDVLLLLKMEARRIHADGPLPADIYVKSAGAQYKKYARYVTESPPLPTGKLAPDFCLPLAVGDHSFRLADLRGRKPVILLFGSFGCDLFCADLPKLQRLSKQYTSAAEFLFVYVAEGPHHLLPPLETGDDDRRAHVQRGLKHFGLSIRCVLDGSDEAVAHLYGGFPRRLVIVDSSGHIALDLGHGLQRPWDFGALEVWLRHNTHISDTGV